MHNFNVDRVRRLIDDAIRSLELDLSGLKVLTEVGSGPFLLTPTIALRAGAEKVFAWTRDSRFGHGADIARDVSVLGDGLDLDLRLLEIAVGCRPPEHVAAANIITNSGFVRPLDREMLKYAKPGTAIPLMFESWEWREGEIDLGFCREAGIRLGGTWENHPSLGVFDQCGTLAAKMLFEAGVEISGNKILVWSSDDFGRVVTATLSSLDAQVICTDDPCVIYRECSDSDVLFLCDYHEQRPFFGYEGILDAKRLSELARGLKVVHLLGSVSAAQLQRAGLEYYPEGDGASSRMTYTLAHLGIRPLIQLQAAGLKVGESLSRGQPHPVCQTIE